MRLSILALAPLASAAAILRRLDGPDTIGYWDAYYSTDVAANGDASRNVTAVYHNEKWGVEIVSTSLTVKPVGQPETETRTNEKFKYYWAKDWASPNETVLYFEQSGFVLGNEDIWIQGRFTPGECKSELGSVCSAETKVEITMALGAPIKEQDGSKV